MVSSHFFSDAVKHRLLVVFTDGEASRDIELFGLGIGHTLKPVFVHVWASGEHIYHHGRVDPFYEADPTSAKLLQRAADLSSGTVVDESKFGALCKAAAHRAVGNGASSRTSMRTRASPSRRGSRSAGFSRSASSSTAGTSRVSA